MTTYRMYDRPTNGTTGQDCGTFTLADLPSRVRDAIAARPNDREWILPALSHGDAGDELPDLEIVVSVE